MRKQAQELEDELNKFLRDNLHHLNTGYSNIKYINKNIMELSDMKTKEKLNTIRNRSDERADALQEVLRRKEQLQETKR